MRLTPKCSRHRLLDFVLRSQSFSFFWFLVLPCSSPGADLCRRRAVELGTDFRDTRPVILLLVPIHGAVVHSRCDFQTGVDGKDAESPGLPSAEPTLTAMETQTLRDPTVLFIHCFEPEIMSFLVLSAWMPLGCNLCEPRMVIKRYEYLSKRSSVWSGVIPPTVVPEGRGARSQWPICDEQVELPSITTITIPRHEPMPRKVS
jgi:hypothetical protein